MVTAMLFAPLGSDDDDDPRWGDAWERAKKALRRDWHQTKYDMRLASGAELNQDFGDTLRQILGSQHIPHGARPNPRKAAGNMGHRYPEGAVWSKGAV